MLERVGRGCRSEGVRCREVLRSLVSPINRLSSSGLMRASLRSFALSLWLRRGTVFRALAFMSVSREGPTELETSRPMIGSAGAMPGPFPFRSRRPYIEQMPLVDSS